MDSTEKKRLLEEYRTVPTGNIADAMALLGLPDAAVTGLVMLHPDQPPAAGFAVTMQQMPRHAGAPEGNLTRQAAVVDTLREGDLLVIDVGGRTDISTGGGMQALRAQIRGAAGYLVNGCLRDVREIAQCKFPVYFKGGCPIKSAPALETVSVNEPVQIGGVQIKNGDLVVMDDTGVVIVPPEHVAAVLEKGKQIQAKEAHWVALLREGKTFAEARELVNA